MKINVLFIGLVSFTLFNGCTETLFKAENDKTTSGLCIYPLQNDTLKGPGDTTSISERPGKIPYLSYNEIISYDTVFNILKLSITTDELKERINSKNQKFAVTLDGQVLYTGSFRKNTMSSTYSKASIIPGDELDTLKANEIRIYNGYPKWYYSDYNDERYQRKLFDRLKRDHKAGGRLFDPAPDQPVTPGNEGVEFFLVKGIKDVKDTPIIKIIGQIDLSLLVLDDNPFITYNQIAFYDTVRYIFGIREPMNLSEQPRGSLMTSAFAITVDRKPIFIGVFYSAVMSVRCSYIHIIPDEPFNNPIHKHILRLYPASHPYPYQQAGKINKPPMIERLKADGKIRNNFIL